jgi:uncharacterized phage protein gp47/JayE
MPNTLYSPRNAGELRDRILRDLRLGAIDTGLTEPPTQPGSDWYLLATGVANMAILGYSNELTAEQAANVFDATGEELDKIRAGEGLPEVALSGSTGKIVITALGAATIPNGQELRLPNGLRIRTVGAVVNPADQSEVDVEAVDVGTGTNLAGGETVAWVVAPTNIGATAKVSEGTPLAGGTDGEDDARKRDRILNARRNRPAGGNWAQLRQFAIEARGDVQDAYVYPALGGPSSVKIVPVRAFDRDAGIYTRALSTAAMAQIRSAVQARVTESVEVVVQEPTDQNCDAFIELELPASAMSGGNGLGWVDEAPWPPNFGEVTDVDANDQLTIDVTTATAPVDGVTHVAWWSPTDRKFYVRLVVAHSGGTGAWLVSLDSPLVGATGEGPAVGDYVSPAAYNLDAYGAAWVDALEALGPGENTADEDRLPRALRHPFISDEDPCALTTTTVARWVNRFPEITNFEASITPTTPTVPGDNDSADPPGVLVPRHFAIGPV